MCAYESWRPYIVRLDLSSLLRSLVSLDRWHTSTCNHKLLTLSFVIVVCTLMVDNRCSATTGHSVPHAVSTATLTLVNLTRAHYPCRRSLSSTASFHVVVCSLSADLCRYWLTARLLCALLLSLDTQTCLCHPVTFTNAVCYVSLRSLMSPDYW